MSCRVTIYRDLWEIMNIEVEIKQTIIENNFCPYNDFAF